MFEISIGSEDEVVLSGRLDASQCEKAQVFFDSLERPHVVDFGALEYISSAGLGVLLKTQKRLMSSGGGLVFRNVNNHIRDIFRYSGFDRIFTIQTPGNQE
jgi:anti-anti-sigma factor